MIRPLVLLCALALPLSAMAIEHVEVCRYCQGRHLPFLQTGDAPNVRKYAPDRLVDVLRIAIDVTPDFAERTVMGETTITFAPISKPVQELKLNATQLAVEEVSGSVEIAEHEATDNDLTILFAQPLAVGQKATVTVRYSAEPKQGLYFRTQAMGYPQGDDHIWTQGEPHEAPSWFPCFDYPNERASTEVTCRVPPAMTVLSNGTMVSEQLDAKTGLKAVHWVQEQPHASYLVCLVAGHLESLKKSHGDLQLRFFTQPSLAQYAASGFGDTDSIIAFYEQETGVAFPWDKYDQVTIRDFNSGGMENTTLTTLTHRTVNSPETENIYARSTRGLDAHETAHQWFGDLVTCEDWSHLWLNEGFATYYTHLYHGHHSGREEMLWGLYNDAKNRVLTQSEDTRPIVYRGYSNPWEQFDFRAYPKGSWVLHMLRSQLGEQVYRQAINRYLKKHQFTSVVTADLVAELEDASGLSLDRFFDQWVYHGGTPKLKITHKWMPKRKLAHVHIEQTQKVSDEVMLFHLPSMLRFYTEEGAVDHPIEITDAEHDFYVSLPSKPEVVRFDPELTVLAEVDFKKPQAMLEKQLQLSDDMIGRIRAATALGKKENKKAVAALRNALNSDVFYGVRIAASEALGKMATDEAFAALVALRGQQDARVRQQVIKDLGRFYKTEAKDVLLLSASRETNPAVASEAIAGLSKYQDPPVLEVLLNSLQSASLKNEVARAAIRAIGDVRDPSLREPMLATLKGRRTEFASRHYGELLTLLAKVWKEADDKRAPLDLLLGAVNDPSRQVRSAAIGALGELADPRAEPTLVQLSESSNARVAGAAKAALGKLESDRQFAPKEVKELRKLVRELREEQQKLRDAVDRLEATEEPSAL